VNRTRLFLIAVLLALVAGFILTATLRQSADDSAARAATEASDNSRNGRSGGTGGGRGAGQIAVATAVAESRDIPITKNAVGWVEPIASVAVRPRIDGLIVTQPVTDGQTVKAGDLLYRLDDKAIQATLAKDRATLVRDQASAGQLQADLTRLKTLHGHDDATQQQVEQQQATLDAATASIAADQAQIQADEVELGYTSITAPIDGRVGVVNDTLGAIVHVADTTPLLTITQMAPLRVSFDVPERDLDAFRQALGAANPAKVSALDPDSESPLSSGKLSFIDSSVDTSSGTIIVKADFDNADGALWPGQYVKIEAELGVHRAATVVPIAAVQFNEKGSFVFLAKPDGTVATRPVTVTDEPGGHAVIGSGVNPNDHVVVEGQLRLHDGSPIKETVVAASDGKPAAADVSTGAKP
jgi:multidrug efflux system membrane fusion protein